MAFKTFLILTSISIVYNLEVENNFSSDLLNKSVTENSEPDKVFDDVYSECLSHVSFICLQKKTLLYLKEMNRLNEVSVIGDYVKFVKLNKTDVPPEEQTSLSPSTDELSYMIDKAVDNFFDSHLIRFRALGKDVIVPNKVEEFVGRKKRKGGGGGGGGDGGKKKMMMIVMMCMKMKLMMMLPAMMGMMGMMSFKGMMFSMMTFMISKMMLLMKILEKKGGGSGGGGGDMGWATGGGGGGAWMPAGGQDYGGGGYDANGQWQSRSIIENQNALKNEPIISYVKPSTRYNQKDNMKKNEEIKLSKPKSRKRRGIIDVLQNAYAYWTSKVMGIGRRKHQMQNNSKYKIVNGVKYIFYPVRSVTKTRNPKEVKYNEVENEHKAVIVDDFNKGEIIEGQIESRSMKKRLKKVKETSEMMDDNPWQ